MEIRGKVALVTGSARRVGRAIATALASRGCHLVLHYRTGAAEARALAAEAARLEVKAVPAGADLADPAAADDITTINRLNFPVGKPVLVYLSTKDVVHSFGVPAMRVKQDAIPGSLATVRFTPIAPGEYEIAFELDGFKKLVRSGVNVEAAVTRSVPVSLEVGGVTEIVQVSADAALLTVTTAAGTLKATSRARQCSSRSGSPALRPGRRLTKATGTSP